MTTDNRLSTTRRLILKAAGLVALIGPDPLSFSLTPALASAGDKYPEDAFRQKNDAEAIKMLYGRTAEPSDKVKLDAPEIAENGAVVPVSVTTTLPGVTSISFFASEIRTHWLPPMSLPKARCRVSPIGSSWRKPAM